MASPTPNKGMTYPPHGGAVNAWDTPLNTNFDQLDLNVAGPYPVTIVSTASGITFNSSGATISSTVNSVTFPSSLVQNLYYNLTGGLTQNLTFVYPAVGGLYVIGNNSSGSFSLSISVGSTITVSPPQGARFIVVTDSAGAYGAQTGFDQLTANTITVSSQAIGTGTASWEVPAGTTAQRPTLTSTAVPSVQAGNIRWNTDTNVIEASDNNNNWRPIQQAIAGGYRNLKITNTTAASPDTQVSFTADAVTVESTAGTAYRLRGVGVTISSSFNGAGGLDVGGLANDTWYAIYMIYSSSGNTGAGLLSAQFNSSSVTMPAGYNSQARFGAILTTGSAHFNRTLQYSDLSRYVVTTGSTTPHLPVMFSSATGSLTVPTWTGIAVGSFVPPTATEITLVAGGDLQGTLGATPGAGVMVAPSTAYGAYNSTSNIPPIVLVESFNTTGGFHGVNDTVLGSIVLESSRIFYVSLQGIGNGQTLYCAGWRDALT